MKSKEVEVMVVDAKLLQPGFWSTVKMDHPFIIRCMWLYPNISLQLVSSKPKGRKGNSIFAFFLAFLFYNSQGFRMACTISNVGVSILHCVVCKRMPETKKKLFWTVKFCKNKHFRTYLWINYYYGLIYVNSWLKRAFIAPGPHEVEVTSLNLPLESWD